MRVEYLTNMIIMHYGAGAVCEPLHIDAFLDVSELCVDAAGAASLAEFGTD